jgi:hypothetical protein
MNTREAFQALLDGKKIYCRDWYERTYISITEQGQLVVVNEDGPSPDVNLCFDENTKFELYQPPKKRVYKALFQDSAGVYSPARYFESEECAQEYSSGFVRLIGEYEEVDE